MDDANKKYRRASNIGLWRYQHLESLKENKKINALFFIANIGNAAMSKTGDMDGKDKSLGGSI